MDFQQEQNLICEENGWGKSTFAAFIRAMFYGFDGERKRSIEENERKRYKPWQGGVFGGNLTFEVNGKRYMIMRVFGEKEGNDTFELRDANTNLLSTDYTSNIGKELFKIDRASFVRTAFIGQNEVETAATDDINAKIGNLTDNTSDLNCYEKATAKLTELMNSMTPRRATGSIAKRINAIAGMERTVLAGSGIADTINTYQGYLQAEADTLEQRKVEREELEKLQKEVSRAQAALAKQEEWRRLKASEAKRKGELSECRQHFPTEVPQEEEIKQCNDACVEMGRVSERMSVFCMSDTEKQEFVQLTSTFSQGVPSEDSIDEKLVKANRLIALKQEIATERISKEEEMRLERFRSVFEKEQETPNHMIGKWNARNTKKTALPSNQAALAALETANVNKNENAGVPIVGVLGLILAMAGIILLFTISEVLGIVSILLGIVIAVIGFVSKRTKSGRQMREENPQIIALKSAISEANEFIARTDEEIKNYLSLHGKTFDEYMTGAILQDIASEFAEYERLSKKQKLADSSTKTSEIVKNKEEIEEFLKGYGVYVPETQYLEALHTLKSKGQRYIVLYEKERSLQEARVLYEEKKGIVSQFLTKYGWPLEADLQNQLKQIQASHLAYSNAQTYHKEALQILKDFEENTDSTLLHQKIMEGELPALEEINQRLDAISNEMESIRKRKQDYTRTLEQFQEQYEEWEETKLQLEKEKELQREEKEKYNRIAKAKEYLTMAKESMTSKYSRPIFESFCKYFEMITQNKTEKYHINANTEITVEEHGMQRETLALSAGYKDLVGLCLRVALVDAMYQEELPMLIMDDPFVNLDDSKVEAAKNFLREIAKKYQVIYFTCSKARK